MKTATRRWGFRQRLELERQVLTEVNNSVLGILPLSGLTEVSIANWHEGLLRIGFSRIEELSQCILEISRRASVDTDCSRDIFSGEDFVPSSSVEDLLLSMRKKLKEIQSGDSSKS